MQHVTTDRLAALGDDEATPLEAAHLAQCDACARELAAYRALVSMARAEREPFGLPLTRWDAIAGALAADGDVAARPSARPLVAQPARAITWPVRRPLQVAAALLFTAGGVMAGRASAGVPVVSLPATPSSAASSATQVSTEAPAFSSVEEALDAKQRSEAIYARAAAYLAQHDTTGAGDGSPVAYRSRLAALDQVISTTREAMRQAPHDPVINGYYLTTLGQREETIRQLNTVLPASLRANSF